MFNQEYDYRQNWIRRSSITNINHTYNKICDLLALLKIKTQARVFLHAVKRNPFKCTRMMVPNVQLHTRHDVYCPISAEIRTVNIQSDLRILLQL